MGNVQSKIWATYNQKLGLKLAKRTLQLACWQRHCRLLVPATAHHSSGNSCSQQTSNSHQATAAQTHTAHQPRLLTQPGITCYFAKPHMSVPVGLPGSTATSILGCRLTPSLMPVNSRSHMPLAHPNQHRLVHDKTACSLSDCCARSPCSLTTLCLSTRRGCPVCLDGPRDDTRERQQRTLVGVSLCTAHIHVYTRSTL